MTAAPPITDRLAIALAQLNPTVGDLAGNLELARKARARAAAEGAHLVLLSELFIAGYPPEDLVLKPSFVAQAKEAAETLAAETADGGPGVVVGVPWPGGRLPTNAALLLDGGEVAAVRHKVHLPNYGVFDEYRVFEPGPLPGPVDFRGVRLGLPICEDCWFEDVAECLAETGAELLLVANGSPFDRGKRDARLGHMVARVTETALPLIFVNQVGGQDELVFDGASFVLQADRTLPVQLPAFEEAFAVTEWRRDAEGWLCRTSIDRDIDDGQEGVWRACVLGLRDYVTKNGFPGVVIGLSGGIDSALTAAMAVDALGPDKVRCLMMPSRFTSQASLHDAAACAEALGVALDEVPIGAVVDGLGVALGPLFDGLAPDITEENLQARARGVILMAISNKFGLMLVTTGNKSEMSVGYATLYGDMAGGYNPLKDLYKTEIYALARMRNQILPDGGLGPAGRVIPEAIIVKAPSAELKENQTDQDTLPPYDELDDILRGLVEEEVSVAELTARGHAGEVVSRIERMLYLAEYKRRQAPPGVKISARNFGRDRRYPITNRFRDRTP